MTLKSRTHIAALLFIALLGAFLVSRPSGAQTSAGGQAAIYLSTGVPSGGCRTLWFDINRSNGALYNCKGASAGLQNGTWNLVGGTGGAGITQLTNDVTAGPGSGSQAATIAKLSAFTTNGFVKTTSGTGTISIDTSTYLTGNQTITLSGDASGSGTTSIAVTNAKVNGVSYPSSPSTNTVPVITGSNTVTYEAVPNAALANSSLTVAGTANQVSASGCGPVSLGGTCTLSVPSSAQLSVAKLTNLTSNGFVKTGSSDGTLAIDASTYLTSSTGVSSIAGTSNQISASASTGAVTLSVPNSAQLNVAKLTNLTTNGCVKTSSSDGTLSVDTSCTAGAGGDFVKIAENVLGSDTATVTFSSIPGTYRNLKLVAYGRITEAVVSDYISIQFNSDSGGNYDFQQLTSRDSTTASGSVYSTTSGRVGEFPGTSSTRSTEVGMIEVLIPGYAGTTWDKLAMSVAGGNYKTNTGGLTAGSWEFGWHSTAAITRIDLLPAANNFKTGSVFTLYGLN